LIGLAGAGKSTITRCLPKYSNQIVVEDLPSLRRQGDIPFFSLNTMLCLPTFISQLMNKRGGRLLSRDEMVWMVLLQGWHRRLRRRAADGEKVIILDQGPVFLLMLLQRYGPANLKWPNARRWWLRMSRKWADTLDGAVWLDAPDEVLAQRIRAREKWHGVKERFDAEGIEYLQQYRVAFEEVISVMSASRDGFKVVRLNTGVQSQEQSAKRVLASLGLGGNDRER
jgi:thymidylate kinase